MPVKGVAKPQTIIVFVEEPMGLVQQVPFDMVPEQEVLG
jgi:hypothetical protein